MQPIAPLASLLPLNGVLFTGRYCVSWAHRRYLIKVSLSMNGDSLLSYVKKNCFVCVSLNLTRYSLEVESGVQPAWVVEGLASCGLSKLYVTVLGHLTVSEFMDLRDASFQVNVILKLCTILSSVSPEIYRKQGRF